MTDTSMTEADTPCADTTGTDDDILTTPAPAHSAFRVLASLADLGEATAAAIAERAGLGYSTVTPKLRAWETSGHAQRFRSGQGQTLWRLTANGSAATASPTQPATFPEPAAPPQAEPGTLNGPASADALASAAATGAEPFTPEPSAGGDGSTDADTAASDTGIHTLAEAVRGEAIGAPGDAGPSEEPSTGPSQSGDRTADPAVRRPSGSLRGAILDILEAGNGRGYKVSELCKAIDRANEGTDAKKASAGAVANAADKLVALGEAVLLVEKPATFGRHSDA